MIDTDGVKDRIRQLCVEKGLNTKIMAYRLNCTERAARAWLYGERVPGIETMINIADTFNVSLDWLYRGVKHGV